MAKPVNGFGGLGGASASYGLEPATLVDGKPGVRSVVGGSCPGKARIATAKTCPAVSVVVGDAIWGERANSLSAVNGALELAQVVFQSASRGRDYGPYNVVLMSIDCDEISARPSGS
jgi:hypothetical protein